MKFLISFVALAIVAVSVDAAGEFFGTQSGALANLPAVQKSVENIGYGAADLDIMEDRLTPLTAAEATTTVKAAETAITSAVDKANFDATYVTAPVA